MLAKMQCDKPLHTIAEYARFGAHSHNIYTVDAKLLLFMERDPATNEHLCTFVLSIYSHQSFHSIHTHILIFMKDDDSPLTAYDLI